MALLCGILLGCGADAENPVTGTDTSYAPAPDADAEEFGSNNSNVIQDPAAAIVTTRPSEVLFYGDLTATTGLDPRVITIRNDTLSAVLITSATIVDDDSKDEMFAGGAAFFSVETPLSDDPIAAYSEGQITVAFEQSLKQRFAMLVITTTHPGFPELHVPLAGKVFVD